MVRKPKFLSFYEFSADLSARLGAGLPKAVVERPLGAPGIQIFVREPERELVEFRMRLGTAELTNKGIFDHFQEDEALRLGVWLASYSAAMTAMKLMQGLSPG